MRLMVPLYSARLLDLEPGHLVLFEGACDHTMVLTPVLLKTAGVKPAEKLLAWKVGRAAGNAMLAGKPRYRSDGEVYREPDSLGTVTGKLRLKPMNPALLKSGISSRWASYEFENECGIPFSIKLLLIELWTPHSSARNVPLIFR